MERQQTWWCSCGARDVNRRGRCAQCERRRRLSEECFGGARDRVLVRDRCCQGCGATENLLVHHRRPGVHAERWLLTLCRTCHVRIHHTWRPAYGFTLRLLWREMHRGLAEQHELALDVASPPATQVLLVDTAAA